MTCAATVAVNVLLFESEQALQAARHLGIFAQSYLVELHLVELGTQFAVFATDSAQIQVVVPGAVEKVLGADDGFFEGSDGRDRPYADEASIASAVPDA